MSTAIAFAALLAALADSTDFVFIPGSSLQMDSPEDESEGQSDEVLCGVCVSSFLMCTHPVTQSEYETVAGTSSGTFVGSDNPAASVSWYDAIAYCNARSESEGLTPPYTVDTKRVVWDRSADGYRLPTQAEWAYACRGAAAVLPYSGPGDTCGSVREWTWKFCGDCNAPADGNLKAAARFRLVRNAEAVAGTAGPNCERKNEL